MNIVVGVTGGIAAYKTVSLVRLLVEAGHEVRVVPTASALNFVGTVTWEAISRNPVVHDVYSNTSEVLHVRLGQEADAVVIAPATANTLAKLAAGLADDLLGNTVLTSRAPLVLAPAMHTEMWEHPATQHNIELLRQRGALIVGPESGRLTGTDTGPGRMSEPQQIFDAVTEALQSDQPFAVTQLSAEPAEPASSDAQSMTLAGISITVSAGGTREAIDPVRYIGNRSSGKQGVAVAAAAARLGAAVHLVGANIDDAVITAAQLPETVRYTRVSNTAELQQTMLDDAETAQVIIMAAAVADFRPQEIVQSKIRKAELDAEAPTIRLTQNPDILAQLVKQRREGQLIVGFGAETAESDEQLLALGTEKLHRKGVDLLVVNRVGWTEGFESADNSVLVLDANENIVLRDSGTKNEIASALLEAISRFLVRV